MQGSFLHTVLLDPMRKKKKKEQKRGKITPEQNIFKNDMHYLGEDYTSLNIISKIERVIITSAIYCEE